MEYSTTKYTIINNTVCSIFCLEYVPMTPAKITAIIVPINKMLITIPHIPLGH